MNELAGKVAIVTGGASGLGYATVEKFVAEGARVVIADRDEERGKELADACGATASTWPTPTRCASSFPPR
jgi:NAD(P)-dependent dehydrogenase (short-subunit alcohol dehydrogenase family)